MRMLPQIVFIAMMFGATAVSAQEIDAPLRAVDSFVPKTSLESVPDIQEKLRQVVRDESRSGYERSRAITYLMYWKDDHRTFLSEVAFLSPAITKAVLLALAKHFGQVLTPAEKDIFFEALMSDDDTVPIVTLMATQLLPDTFARELLTFGQSTRERVANRAHEIHAFRFGSVE